MWQVTLEELGIDKEVLAADPRPFSLSSLVKILDKQNTSLRTSIC